MSIFSLSLLFLSPIIGFATYLLLQESRDPLKGFHDNFQKALVTQNDSLESQRYNSERKSRNRLINSAFAGGLLILFIGGASFSTLLLLAFALAIYLYWEKGSESRLRKKEMREAEEEFPSIIELFAVLVSAGESPTIAIQRVTNKATGQMAKKFSSALSELQSGSNLTQALEILGSQVDSAAIRRFCDTLILAMERGTSLSEVLTRQVEEVRASHHASLLTAAGKAEIALMIPVIFLILPISVLFALWPSYISLGQSVM
jgi:tight adherence protein C